MIYDKNKCQILHLGRVNSEHTHRLGMGHCLAIRDLGVPVNIKLNVSQQCAQAAREANCPIECSEHGIASWVREGIVPLCSALLQPHLEHWVHFWASHNIKDIKLWECVWESTERGPHGKELQNQDCWSSRSIQKTLSMIWSAFWVVVWSQKLDLIIHACPFQHRIF